MKNTNNSKPKSRGPIRWSGFVPVAVLIAITTVYFTLFFDSHLKYLLQKLGTKANGAKVDIGHLKTSFWNARFEIGKIEVTNPKEPMKNRVEIAKAVYQFLFRPVLSKKFVITDASIEGIRYGTPRTYSGAVPQPPAPPKTEPSALQKSLGRVEDAVRKKAEDTAVGRLEGLLKSQDIGKELKSLGEDSKSYKRIKEIQGNLDKSTKEWGQKASELPNEKTIQEYRKRIEAITKVQPKTVDDITRTLSEADKLKNDVTTSVDKANTLRQSIGSGVDKLFSEIKGIEKVISEDVDSVRAQLKLPSLSMKDITPALLGPKLSGYLSQAIYWVELSRKYFPKKEKSDAKVVKQERKKGTDVRFIAERVYPTFLLERAAIESSLSTDPQMGNLKGELLGLTSDPPLYGKPTQLRLEGGFPRSEIQGVSIQGILDHTGTESSEKFVLKVDSFPVREWKLTEGEDFKLAVPKASGSFQVGLNFLEEQFDASLLLSLREVNFDVDAKNAQLKEIFGRVLKGLSAFQVNARLKSGENSEVMIASDLGAKLSDSLQQEFKVQLAALNEKIKKNVEAEVENRKKELQARFDQEKAKVLAPVEEKLKTLRELEQTVKKTKDKLEQEKNALLKRVEDEAKAKVRAAEEEQKRRLKEQADKEAEKVKKSIKLPF